MFVAAAKGDEGWSDSNGSQLVGRCMSVVGRCCFCSCWSCSPFPCTCCLPPPVSLPPSSSSSSPVASSSSAPAVPVQQLSHLFFNAPSLLAYKSGASVCSNVCSAVVGVGSLIPVKCQGRQRSPNLDNERTATVCNWCVHALSRLNSEESQDPLCVLLCRRVLRESACEGMCARTQPSPICTVAWLPSR